MSYLSEWAAWLSSVMSSEHNRETRLLCSIMFSKKIYISKTFLIWLIWSIPVKSDDKQTRISLDIEIQKNKSLFTTQIRRY